MNEPGAATAEPNLAVAVWRRYRRDLVAAALVLVVPVSLTVQPRLLSALPMPAVLAIAPGTLWLSWTAVRHVYLWARTDAPDRVRTAAALAVWVPLLFGGSAAALASPSDLRFFVWLFFYPTALLFIGVAVVLFTLAGRTIEYPKPVRTVRWVRLAAAVLGVAAAWFAGLRLGYADGPAFGSWLSGRYLYNVSPTSAMFHWAAPLTGVCGAYFGLRRAGEGATVPGRVVWWLVLWVVFGAALNVNAEAARHWLFG